MTRDAYTNKIKYYVYRDSHPSSAPSNRTIYIVKKQLTRVIVVAADGLELLDSEKKIIKNTTKTNTDYNTVWTVHGKNK